MVWPETRGSIMSRVGKHGRSSESILFKTVYSDLKSCQPLCGNCIQFKKKKKKTTTWGLWDHTPRWSKSVLMPSVLVRDLWANSASLLGLFLSCFPSTASLAPRDWQWWCKWMVLLPRERRGVKLTPFTIHLKTTGHRHTWKTCALRVWSLSQRERVWEREEGRGDVLFLWRQVPKNEKRNLEVKSSHQESKLWVTTGDLATRMGLPESWNMVIYLVPRGVALKSVCGHHMSRENLGSLLWFLRLLCKII